MGVVYEAEQLSLGRHVALKVLPERLIRDPKQRNRFEREAKAAARLHHTNIVPVFGVGEEDGTPYYAMQFIPGLGLDQVLEVLKRQRGRAAADRLEKEANPARPEGMPTASDVARSLLNGGYQAIARPGSADGRGAPGAPTVDGLDGPASPAPPLEEPMAVDRPEKSRRPTADDRPVDPSGREAGPEPMPLSNSSATLLGLGSGSDPRHPGSARPTYWRGIARMGSQVAEALAYAHSQGVLHRDIKPSNLLLDVRGVVWVADFGLAKIDDRMDLTHTGDILGTLRYMPPEAFEGRHDARGDVYSLGLSLYEMLAFRPAFDEPDRGRLIRRVTSEEPARLRAINPEVPRDLETVVHKAIERDPSHRYATAADLAEDLRRYVEDRPILARRASESEKFRRWCRRNPVPAGLLAALVLVFLGAFGLVTWKWREAVAGREATEVQRLRAVAAERAAGLARDRAEASGGKASIAAEKAGRSLYYGQIARARLEYQANNIAQAEASLDLCDPARRGWEWYFLRGLNRSELFRLEGHDGWVYQVAYSPDGRLIATAGGGNPFFRTQEPSSITSGQAILWDAATGRQLRLFGGATHLVTNVAFSPDGKTLAWSGLDGLARLQDIASGQLIRAVGDGKVPSDVYRNNEACVPLAFSHDGARLAIGQGDHSMALVDVATGAVVARLPACDHGYREAAFSPDGRWIATTSCSYTMNHGAPRVWDAATGAEAARLESSSGCTRLCFGPDSRLLAGVSISNAIMVWELPGGKVRKVLSGHDAETINVAFHPDGLGLASSGRDGTVRLLDLSNGRVWRVIRGHTEAVVSLAFSPDGFRLVSGSYDGTSRVWDLTTDPEVADVQVRSPDQTRNQEVEAIAYDRGSGQFTSMDRNGVIGRVESDTHRPIDILATGLRPGWATPAEPSCFDAEGRRAIVVPMADRRRAICFDPRGDGERVALKGHELPIRWATLCSDGSRAATAALVPPAKPGDVRGEVIVWDAGLGRPLLRRTFTGDQPRRIALDPHGRLLAVSAVRNGIYHGKDGPDAVPYLVVLEVDTGREVLRQDPLDDQSWAVGFSPDGRRLAAACLNRKLYLWDMDRRRLDATSRQGAAEAWDLAFSPDGRRLAMASRRMVELADAETGEEILILRGRGQQSLDTHGFNPRVRFSPDGTRILAVCDDYFPAISEWSIDAGNLGGPDARLRSVEGHKRNLTFDQLIEARNVGSAEPLLLAIGRYEGLRLDVRENIGLGGALARIGRWDQADAAFLRAAESGRDRDPLEAGNAYSGLGRWGRARTWFARLEGRTPHEFFRWLSVDDWMIHAAYRLMVDDREGYRRLCADMAGLYGTSSRPNEVMMLARTCTLAPGALDDPAGVVRLAERARTIAEGTDQGSKRPLALIDLGTAHDRAGNPGRAEEIFRQALALRPEPLIEAIGRARLAIALRHQGRRRESRASLDEALRWTSPVPDRPGPVWDNPIFPGFVPIDEWWEYAMACREALATIGDDGFPADPFAR